MSIDWTPFVELVQQTNRFLLTGHVRPDCDVLGSQLGLAGLLDALGKDVWIVNDDPVPPRFAFIDPDRRIRTLGSFSDPQPFADREVVVVLDTSSWAQLGAMADVVRSFGERVVVIDHHLSGDDMPGLVLKNTSAEACGRLVAESADALGVPLAPPVARPLFCAIATDTGWFRYRSVSAVTYRLAGRLIEAGADPASIYRDLYQQDTLARIRLRGVILERVTTEMEGRLIYTWVHHSDFERLGAVRSDTEDVINETLAVAGTEVAAIFIEQSDGRIKVSLRSRNGIDCSAIARAFGGGGHQAAAGASLDGPLDAARSRLLDAVKRAMRGA